MRHLALLLVATLAAAACASSGDGEEQALRSPSAGQPTSTASLPPTPAPTAAPRSDRFRFVALGDFGSGSSAQFELAERMCRFHERKPFDVVVTTGDNVYLSGDPARFDEVFFEPYACLLDAGVRFRATLGNHDIETDNGRPELEEPAFGFEGRNYVFREGGVRFVMADSNFLRTRWLRAALRPADGDRWTVVVFHHPVFSSGEHGSTPGLEHLPRLFRHHGVDLVLNGHDHDYEASQSLRGIRYVVTGGGGASLRDCGIPLPTSEVCIARYHFLEVVAGPKRIEVRAIPRRGRPFHSFVTAGRA